ncbi:MAG: diguanylate cyclase domain-containing protein [Cyanophyceae cyanobacterium]
MEKRLKLLLVEDNIAEIELIQELFTEIPAKFELKNARRLDEGSRYLQQEQFDVVLLDLSLPDSRGLETLVQVQCQAFRVPIIVLTALDDANLALEAVRSGAQDYLVKGQLEGELLARSIDYAIERQQIQETLRRQVDKERLLVKTAERLHRTFNLANIWQTTVEAIEQFISPTSVTLYYCLAERTSWQGEAMQHSSENTLTLPILQHEIVAQELPVVNLVRENQLWGRLTIQKEEPLKTWEVDFLQQLTQQLAVAIQQAELYQQLEQANRELQKLAITDGLTKIANRRRFEENLAQEWQRLTREQQPLSLLLCDIDSFKAYNDTYGHPAGDACLQKVSEVIQQSIQRPADLVARYGGEEFAVLLPNTNSRGALKVARRIARQLAVQKLPHRATRVPTANSQVTLSIGTATQIPEGQSPVVLVMAADAALYQAKNRRRNQIVQAGEDGGNVPAGRGKGNY